MEVKTMTPAEFNIEKTNTGIQYVIPGTERPIKLKRRIYKSDGNQFVIPGAERISTTEHLSRLADKPLPSTRGQIGLRGLGLFGN